MSDQAGDEAFLAELPDDGDWHLTSDAAGRRVATDISGKHPPVYRDRKGAVSSRTRHGLQPTRPAQ